MNEHVWPERIVTAQLTKAGVQATVLETELSDDPSERDEYRADQRGRSYDCADNPGRHMVSAIQACPGWDLLDEERGLVERTVARPQTSGPAERLPQSRKDSCWQEPPRTVSHSLQKMQNCPVTVSIGATV